MEPQMHIFDAHNFIKSFQAESSKEKQAELIVKFWAESKDYDLSKLSTREQLNAVKDQISAIKEELSKFATKEQVKFLEEKLTEKIANVEEKLSNKIDNKINESTNQILRWVMPFLIGSTVAVIGIVIAVIARLF